MEDEVTVLICLPVEGGRPGRYIVPGSVQGQCDDCSTEVWVAPSGQELMKERTTIVVCMKCAQGRVNKEPGPLEITGKQVEEIKTWKKRN